MATLGIPPAETAIPVVYVGDGDAVHAPMLEVVIDHLDLPTWPCRLCHGSDPDVYRRYTMRGRPDDEGDVYL